MKRNVILAVVALAGLGGGFPAGAAAGRESGFGFKAPDGWVNVADVGDQDLPEFFLRRKQSGAYAFFAFNPKDTVFFSNVNAVVQTGRIRITQEFMDHLAGVLNQRYLRSDRDHSPKRIGVELGSTGITIRSAQAVRFGRVTAGRITQEGDFNGRRIAQTVYYLPGPERFAILTFSTLAERAAAYEGIFDAAARATKGVGYGYAWARMLVVALIMASLGASAAIIRRRKRTQDAARKLASRTAGDAGEGA